jgi:hypothetical protein
VVRIRDVLLPSSLGCSATLLNIYSKRALVIYVNQPLKTIIEVTNYMNQSLWLVSGLIVNYRVFRIFIEPDIIKST